MTNNMDLVKASAKGDLTAVRALVEQGLDPKECDSAALRAASLHHRTDVLLYLLPLSNPQAHYSQALLHALSQYNDTARTALWDVSDVTGHRSGSSCLLATAAYYGRLDLVDKALSQRAVVKQLDKSDYYDIFACLINSHGRSDDAQFARVLSVVAKKLSAKDVRQLCAAAPADAPISKQFLDHIPSYLVDLKADVLWTWTSKKRPVAVGALICSPYWEQLVPSVKWEANLNPLLDLMITASNTLACEILLNETSYRLAPQSLATAAQLSDKTMFHHLLSLSAPNDREKLLQSAALRVVENTDSQVFPPEVMWLCKDIGGFGVEKITVHAINYWQERVDPQDLNWLVSQCDPTALDSALAQSCPDWEDRWDRVCVERFNTAVVLSQKQRIDQHVSSSNVVRPRKM